MLVKALKDFSSVYNGNVVSGAVFEMPLGIAIQMQEFGLVELIGGETAQPKKPEAQPSASLQAGQASQKNSADTLSEPGQTADAQSLPSIPQESQGQDSATTYTQPITSGGESTKKKGRPKRKE